MRIALFDDDAEQTAFISSTLAQAGHACVSHTFDVNPIDALRRDEAGLLILHWQSSGHRETDVLRLIRNELPACFPVLAVTAAHDDEAILSALAAGANDYIVKPLRRRELVARATVLMRRACPD